MIEKTKKYVYYNEMIDESTIKTTLGMVIKDLRHKKGITQEKLAEFLGIERQSIAAIETGKRFISSELLTKLCNFFNVEPYVFFLKQSKTYKEEDLDNIKQIISMLEKIYSIVSKTKR